MQERGHKVLCEPIQSPNNLNGLKVLRILPQSSRVKRHHEEPDGSPHHQEERGQKVLQPPLKFCESHGRFHPETGRRE